MGQLSVRAQTDGQTHTYTLIVCEQRQAEIETTLPQPNQISSTGLMGSAVLSPLHSLCFIFHTRCRPGVCPRRLLGFDLYF